MMYFILNIKRHVALMLTTFRYKNFPTSSFGNNNKKQNKNKKHI